MGQPELKKNLKINKKDSKENNTKIRVTLPYVRGLSEALSQVFQCYGVVTLMKPHITLNRILVHVHPKDKRTPQENAVVLYQVPCKDCLCKYTGTQREAMR